MRYPNRLSAEGVNMAIPGYGTAVGVIFRIIDTLWPSKKEAAVQELQNLTVEYNAALIKRQDVRAAVIRKQMVELRRRLGYADE